MEKGREMWSRSWGGCIDGGLSAEDGVLLQEDQRHNLVLIDHVDRHVSGLGLGSQQSGPEHDGHALRRHAVLIPVIDHSGGGHKHRVRQTERERERERRERYLIQCCS